MLERESGWILPLAHRQRRNHQGYRFRAAHVRARDRRGPRRAGPRALREGARTRGWRAAPLHPGAHDSLATPPPSSLGSGRTLVRGR